MPGPYVIVPIFLLLLCSALDAQEDLPRLEASNVSNFDIEDGLPISCAYSCLLDEQGRFWVNPCFSQSEHKSFSFYRFDGQASQSYRLGGTPEQLEGQAALSGFDDRGRMYGFFRQTNRFFLFDLESDSTWHFSLEEPAAEIQFMDRTAGGEVLLYAALPGKNQVYRYGQGALRLIAEWPTTNEFRRGRPWTSPDSWCLTDTDLWYLELPGIKTGLERNWQKDQIFWKIDLQSGAVKGFSLEDLFGTTDVPARISSAWILGSVAEDPNGQIVVLLSGWGKYFRFDPSGKHIEEFFPFPSAGSSNLPELRKSGLYTDRQGNLLYLVQYPSQQFDAILVDKAGNRYDYSSVLKSCLAGSRYENTRIQQVWSEDFRERAYVVSSGGLVVADLKLFGSLSTYLPGEACRGIVEPGADRYLVQIGGQGGLSRLSIGEPLSSVFVSYDQLCESEQDQGLSSQSSVGTDRLGRVYFCAKDKLLRLNAGGDCTLLPVGEHFNRFTIHDGKSMFLLTRSRDLLYCDLETDEVRPALQGGKSLSVEGTVNELLVSRDSSLWVASLKGLYRVDLVSGETRRYGLEDGFQDERIMCLHEDEVGRIWFGTFHAGLHILDPPSGALTIVDQRSGLSNNTVVGILPDAEGARWLATYNGLTLVTPTGKVLSRVFEEDGLSNNEFNRFSSLKDSRGRLLFGTIDGLNVIEPKPVKEQLLRRQDLRIYLSALTYFDAKKAADTTQLFGLSDPVRIELPATHRYLGLRFALSSLVNPEGHRYAYRLEGLGNNRRENWTFIGGNPELNLNDLPPGKYRILVQGSDYRGNWTTEPLVIPVHVREFFYRQLWFYVLCFLLLAGLVAGWMYRQRIARERLERELEARTSEIMQARDQLIAQEKLASLGQLTAGIAHEIKNPLNFITNFAEGSIDLVEELQQSMQAEEGALTSAKDQLQQQLLLELRENAQSIRQNGMRTNEIIRNMMDHIRGGNQRFVATDLNALVKQSLKLAYHGFRLTRPGFQVQLETRLQADLPLVAVIPQDLGRVVLNILNNAFDALAHKWREEGASYTPVLVLSTSRLGRKVQIRIRDNGPGIAPDLVDQIFHPFFTTKPPGNGNTGLGLSISHDIVLHHSGTLEVQTEEGTFTEFIVTLPNVAKRKSTTTESKNSGRR